MKTMTLLAALALVALVSGATPALALGTAQAPGDGATCSNCATPTPPAQKIVDARAYNLSHLGTLSALITSRKPLPGLFICMAGLLSEPAETL